MSRSGLIPSPGTRCGLPREPRVVLCTLIVACATLLVPACSAPTPAAPAKVEHAVGARPLMGGTTRFFIDFEGGGPAGASVNRLLSRAGAVTARTVTRRGGVIRLEGGPGGGRAARFPSRAEAAAGSLAVLRIDTVAVGDSLSPGQLDFQFGADVFYPEGAQGDSDQDNGDNLFQRGLFDDPGQFKLQVDHARPACRMAGVDGEVLVSARTRLAQGQWYRLVCQRAGDQITIFVAALDEAAEPEGWDSWSALDRTGEIPRTRRPTSVSIGGKLSSAGGLVPDAPDQFTGVLDNLVYRSFAP